MNPFFLKLSCGVQTYAWGKKGEESEVARLKKGGDPDFVVDEEQNYAELWMGTHNKAPSRITYPPQFSGQLLSDWLKDNQWALGDRVANEFLGQLPFLFKVLSINRALSIQAHPTTSHAEQLHLSAPDKYPDPNHKPELVVALSDFGGFCSFRPIAEIQRFVAAVPELRAVITNSGADLESFLQLSGDESTEEECREGLRLVFEALMTCPAEVVQEHLKKLVGRLEDGKREAVPAQEASLVLRLNGQFPGDVGCFCTFFLNYLQLRPGESLFLAPNEPHAYLYGEVVECMACSDNVVRAGLTVKFRDKATLCQMLTYTSRTPEETRFPSQKHPDFPHVVLYDPPTPEFTVAKITVPRGTREFIEPAVAGPSIFIVISGSLEASADGIREQVGKGTVIFLPAGENLKLYPRCDEDLLVFQAFCSRP